MLRKNFFFISVSIIVLVTFFPLAFSFLSSFLSNFSLDDFWVYFINSLIDTSLLLVTTSLLSLLWSVPAAYFCAFSSFKGRWIFPYLLILPIAVPTYLNSFIFSEIFHFGGNIYYYINELFGFDISWQVHSVIGASLVLSLGLYPYIFLALYISLVSLPKSIFDKINMIGISKKDAFLKIIFPISMPIILSSTLLVIMESMADFGTTSFYGVNSLSVALFNLWNYSSDINLALKMSLLFFCFIISIITFRHFLCPKEVNTTEKISNLNDFKINGNIIHIFICMVPFVGGFVIPFSYFSYFTFIYYIDNIIDVGFLIWDSVYLALISAFFATVIGLFLSCINRFVSLGKFEFIIPIITSAYAIPGTILAIAILFSLSKIDLFLIDTFGISNQKIFSNGLFALILAYYVRFLTISYRHISSAQENIKQSFFDRIKITGISDLKILTHFLFPMLKSPIFMAFIFIVIDILKELPMTLILRPVGYDNLATYSYNMAALEQIPQSSPSSMMLILLGIIICIVPFRSIRKLT